MLSKKQMITMLLTLMLSFNAMACTDENCPLPANFNSLIADYPSEKQAELAKVYKTLEAEDRKLFNFAYLMRKDKLISVTTMHKIDEFIKWSRNMRYEKPIYQWDMTEFKKQAKEIDAAIAHDKKYAMWYQVVCFFSDKYCW